MELELTKAIEILDARKSVLQNELQAVTLAIDTLKSQYQPELKVIENANKTIETLQSQKDSLENEKEAIIAEKEAIKVQKETLEAQLADTQTVEDSIIEATPAPVLNDIIN